MPRPDQLPQPWSALASRYGGATQLSAKLHVSYSTLYRWARGVMTPDEDNQAILAGLFAKHNLPLPVYRTLRPE